MTGGGLRVRARWEEEIYMIGKRRATGVHTVTRHHDAHSVPFFVTFLKV
jgi:hypothetical protein